MSLSSIFNSFTTLFDNLLTFLEKQKGNVSIRYYKQSKVKMFNIHNKNNIIFLTLGLKNPACVKEMTYMSYDVVFWPRYISYTATVDLAQSIFQTKVSSISTVFQIKFLFLFRWQHFFGNGRI